MTEVTQGPRVCVRPHGWIDRRADGAFAALAEWARHAERLGFDGLFLGDRMLPEATAEDGVVYGRSMLEVTTLLAGLAASTERLLLGSLVLVLPYRHPLPLAKTLASLDVISEGRIVLGAGVGWNRREFAALGIDPSERGRRFEAALETMRRLWRGERVSERTPWWELEDVALAPLPHGGRQLPVWIASFSPESALDWTDRPPRSAWRVLERVGRLADGWVPLIYSASSMRRLEPAVLAAAWQEVLEAAERHGRGRDDVDFVLSDWCCVVESESDRRRCERALATFFAGDWEDAKRTYTIGTGDEVAEALLAQTEGIDRVDAWVLTPLVDDDLGQLDALRERVVPALRARERERA